MTTEKDEEKKYRLFLANIKGFGGITIGKLIEEAGSARNVYTMQESSIRSLSCLKEKQKEHLIYARKTWQINKEYQRLCERKIHIVSVEEEDYPSRLRNVHNAPYLLYYYGRLPQEEVPTVAVVGARMCSDYGRRNAELFGRELSLRGIQVISGMASGIDSIAQKAAMETGGRSFGILGSGVDVCYPASSHEIYGCMRTKGGIISEFPPGTSPEAPHFPMRNRIISGLSDLVLVIEAKEKSGTAITVNMALEQGKDVYAVPGRIDDSLSAGCNRLIKEGAGMACTVNDVINGLGFMGKPLQSDNMRDRMNELSDLEKEIMACLREQAMSAEELFQKSQNKTYTIQELLSTLLMMQIKDYIDCQAGKYFIR